MSQRGNILFLILLAIILFAALTYAVMSQREQAPASMHKEQADSFAATLMQEAALLEQNIMRAKVVDGVPDYGFDFNGANSNGASNSTCTAMPDPSVCRMARQGKASLVRIPDWATTGSSTDLYATFMVVQIANIGTSAEEVLYIRKQLRREICAAINKAVGAPIDLTQSDSIDGDNVYRIYSGAMTALTPSGAQIGEQPGGAAGIAGRNSFCFYNSAWGYIFAHVLIPR